MVTRKKLVYLTVITLFLISFSYKFWDMQAVKAQDPDSVNVCPSDWPNDCGSCDPSYDFCPCGDDDPKTGGKCIDGKCCSKTKPPPTPPPRR